MSVFGASIVLEKMDIVETREAISEGAKASIG